MWALVRQSCPHPQALPPPPPPRSLIFLLVAFGTGQEHSSFVAPGAVPLPTTVRTCPASYGVRCGGVGEDTEDGVSVIISKGCILPAQGTAMVEFMPAVGDRPATPVYIEVVEIGQSGEGGASTARLLGTLAFEDVLSPAEGGVAVQVKVGLTLRSAGVLKIEAVEVGSGATRELIIGNEVPEDS